MKSRINVNKVLIALLLLAVASCSQQYNRDNVAGASAGLPTSLGNVEFVEIEIPGKNGQPGEVIQAFPSEGDFEAAINAVETTATYLTNIGLECETVALDQDIEADQETSFRVDCYAGFYVQIMPESPGQRDIKGSVKFVRLTEEQKNRSFPDTLFDFEVNQDPLAEESILGFVGLSAFFSGDTAQLVSAVLVVTPSQGSGEPITTTSSNILLGCDDELDNSGSSVCGGELGGEGPAAPAPETPETPALEPEPELAPGPATTTCSNGIPGVPGGGVCCAASCGRCGGFGCGDFPGGSDNCCSSAIHDSGNLCSVTLSAPCIVDQTN